MWLQLHIFGLGKRSVTANVSGMELGTEFSWELNFAIPAQIPKVTTLIRIQRGNDRQCLATFFAVTPLTLVFFGLAV